MISEFAHIFRLDIPKLNSSYTYQLSTRAVESFPKTSAIRLRMTMLSLGSWDW